MIIFIAFLNVTDLEDQDAAKVLALDSPSDVKDMVLNITFLYLLVGGSIAILM